jgi:aspartyl protease family protein
VRRRLLWILLLALLAVTVTLAMFHGADEGVTGLSFTMPSISFSMVQVGVVIFVVGMLLAGFRRRFSEAFEAALLWIVIAVFVLVGYTYRGELRDVGNRVLAQVIPGYAAASGRVVELTRGRAGDFPVTMRVNGARVPMILDTGASAVMLTHDAAKAAGLPLELLSYTVSLETANGRTRAAPVTIDKLAIGNIMERSVPALVVPAGQLKTNLLGMTFLNRLESWQVRGDRLMLRGYP